MSAVGREPAGRGGECGEVESMKAVACLTSTIIVRRYHYGNFSGDNGTHPIVLGGMEREREVMASGILCPKAYHSLCRKDLTGCAC